MSLLPIIFIGSLALLLPASAEVRKKIIIHIPLEVHEKHHTHTVFKHIYHEEKKEHKHTPQHKGKDSYEFLGHGKGKISNSWKKEPLKWPESQWKESRKIVSQWHGSEKNPHRISSYVPNYNHEKKRSEIFEHELELQDGHHKYKGSHLGGHKHFEDQGFNVYGRDLKNSFGNSEFSHEDDSLEEGKKQGLGITKVISHTVYHD